MVESSAGSLPASENVEQSDLSELAAGTGIALVGRFSGSLLDLTRQAILARLISQTDFGIYTLALTVFRLATMFSSVGQSAAVIRYGAERRRNPAEFGAVLRVAIGLALVSSTTIFVLLFIFADQIAVLVFNQAPLAPVLRAFAVILPIWSLMDVSLAATMIDKRIAFAVGAEEVVQPVVYLILLIAVVACFQHVSALDAAVWTGLVSFAVIALMAVWVMVRRYPAFHKRAFSEGNRGLTRTMARYGIPVALANVFLWSSPLFDRLLMGVFSTLANAGMYVVVAQISTLFTLIGSAIDTIQGPITAILITGDDIARLERVTQSAVRIGLLLGIPALIILSVYSGTVLAILFGPAFAAGGSALFVLSAALLLRVISDRAIGLLVMSGYNRRWLAFSVISFALNIALDALLIPRFGMIGSAMGTGVVNIFLLIALAGTTWNRLHIRLFSPSFLPFIPIALISLCAGLIPTWLGVHLPDLPGMIVFAALSTAVFSLLVWRFALPDEEKGLLRGTFKRLMRFVRRRR